MSTTEFLARGCTFELNNGSIAVPSWVAISNVKNWSHSPSANDADTTTYDDAGRMTHMKASRGDGFTVECLGQEDPDTGARDAGQLAAEVWAQLVGPDSRKQFRITTPAGNILLFEATATTTLGGGGNDDPNAWSLDITVTGALANSAQSAVPVAPTSPVAVAGNDSITGTWTAPAGTIEGYEVRVYLDSTDVVVLTVSTSIAAVNATGLANTTAYYFDVRARTSGGWGPYSAVSNTVTTT